MTTQSDASFRSKWTEAISVPYCDEASLRWASAFTEKTLHEFLASNMLSAIVNSEWPSLRENISRYFSLGSQSHCLKTMPHIWANFTEPQITKGFAYFLGNGRQEIQSNRKLALLRSLNAIPLGISLDDIIEAKSISEAPTGDGSRIDLLVYVVNRSGQRFGAIIEAKFEYELSISQLRTYEIAAQKRYQLARKRSRYIVVAPALTNKLKQPLAQSSDQWQFTTWERFLIRYEAEIDEHADDEDFARFRRTIWHRAGHL